MQITSVSYRKLISGPGFTHQAVEMTASVDTGDTAEQVLQQLRLRVNNALGDHEGIIGEEGRQAMRGRLREAVMKVESVMDEAFASDLPF